MIFSKCGAMEKFPTEQDAIKIIENIKGKKFSEYREKWKKINNFEIETEFPYFLHIELLYKCNFRCPMCTHGVPELFEKFAYHERFKKEDVDKVLKEGSKYGCPSVSFQGDNEPFLIKNITDYFKLAKNYGYLDIMVNSNGSLIDEKLAHKIVNSGLTRLRFSLDAFSKETYNKIRIRGNYEQVHKNIENFLKIRKSLNSKLPIVGVNFVEMKNNTHERDSFINYWKNKVDYIVFQPFWKPDLDMKYNEMDINKKENEENIRCNQPWQRLFIKGNNEVHPCCAMFNKYLPLGNLSKMSLFEAWNSDKMKELRSIHKNGKYYENDVCLKCLKQKW